MKFCLSFVNNPIVFNLAPKLKESTVKPSIGKGKPEDSKKIGLPKVGHSETPKIKKYIVKAETHKPKALVKKDKHVVEQMHPAGKIKKPKPSNSYPPVIAITSIVKGSTEKKTT